MPITVTLINNPVSPGVTCGEQALIRAGEVMHQGCEVFTKLPSYVVSKGQTATIEHQLRNSAGEPIDITNCMAPDIEDNAGQVIFRFQEASGQSEEIHQIVGYVEDLASGVIRVDLNTPLTSESCIHKVSIGVTNSFGHLVFTNSAMLLVERSLFGNFNTASIGPMTREEIRLALRDVMAENDLTDDVDFDDIEIIHAMVRPVMEWNEQPPNVWYYKTCTFPFREHWTRSTCAQLLRIAAAWFERNKMLTAAGGVHQNDRERAKDYLSIANMLQSEWMRWMRRQKTTMNMEQAYGSYHTGGW
jgi:hypothetical protein